MEKSGDYAVYLRKSRADADAERQGAGETLSRHREALRELAERLGLRVCETYQEIVTGDTLAGRPEMQRLLRDVESGRWRGVLVMDVDRLGRGDSIDQGVILQTFIFSGTQIITPGKVYDPANPADTEFSEMKLFFSRVEYRSIKGRLQAGRERSAREGKYMGSRAPFGYARERVPGGRGFTLRPVPEKAALVREIYAGCLRGEGAQAIANRLNAAEIRTDLGNPFSAGYVRDILKNPAYTGMLRWNQRTTVVRLRDGQRRRTREKNAAPLLVRGLHVPIVAREIWDAAQDRLAARASPRKNAALPLMNPLSGLCRCGVCGRVMLRRKNGGEYLKCPTPGCPTCSARLDAVESAILEALGGLRLPRLEPAGAGGGAAEDARSALLRREAGVLRQLKRLPELLEQNIYSADEYTQRRSELRGRLERIRAELLRLREAEDTMERAAELRAALPESETLAGAYYAAPDAALKNALLKACLDSVVYRRSEKSRRGEAPGAHLLLELFPLAEDWRGNPGQHDGSDEFFSLPLFPQSSCAFEEVGDSTVATAGAATGGSYACGSVAGSCGSCGNKKSTCSHCGTTCLSGCGSLCPRCGCAMTSVT